MGRFLQKDPHPGRINDPATISNKYMYSRNNPVVFGDPSGADFWQDLGAVVAIATGAIGILALLPGVTLAGAASAVGSTLAGASAAGLAMSAVTCAMTGDWSNFWSNWAAFTKFNLAISAGFLVLSAGAASLFGGGISGIGSAGTFQGYVSSKSPIFMEGGLTIGSSAIYSGANATTPIEALVGGGALGAHEYGHTLQFITLSMIFPRPEASWTAYMGLGIIGLTPVGLAWEQMASGLGKAF